MAEWTVCPHCRLKHVRRADGTCPRCHRSPDDGAAGTRRGRGATLPDVYDDSPPPNVEGRYGSHAAPYRAAPWQGSGGRGALRLAGLLLVLGAGLVGVTALTMPKLEPPSSHVQMAHIAIDALLGAGLLLGLETFRPWAVIRAALGGGGLATYFVLQQMHFVAALEAGHALGLLLLLAGRPGAARAVTGGLVSLASLAAAGVSVYGTLNGDNPLGHLALWGQIESSPARTVEGLAARYRLTLPNDRWHLRRADAMRLENADADRWLIRPDRDAHILVIAMQLPTRGQVVQVTAAQVNQGFVEGLRRRGTGLEILPAGAVTAGPLAAPLAHLRCTVQGVQREWYVASFVRGGRVVQLVAVARPKAFALVEDEVLRTFASFVLP